LPSRHELEAVVAERVLGDREGDVVAERFVGDRYRRWRRKKRWTTHETPHAFLLPHRPRTPLVIGGRR
jgi:hypothetical protein